MNTLVQDIFNSVVEGEQPKVAAEKVLQALAGGVPAEEILQQGLVGAMDKVGQLFEEGEFFVPEMLVSARAMQGGLSVLKPHLTGSSSQPSGRVVIGTVKGDLHDIGKNLVGMMLEGAGFEIIDLGVDVSPEKFVEAVKETQAHVLALSALLTTTMQSMKQTVDAVKADGVKVKVVVGGAPVTEDYAKQIGADGCAADASRAVALVRSLVTA